MNSAQGVKRCTAGMPTVGVDYPSLNPASAGYLSQNTIEFQGNNPNTEIIVPFLDEPKRAWHATCFMVMMVSSLSF